MLIQFQIKHKNTCH